MTYERKTYEQKLHDKLEEKPYRPETIQWIGRICRVGHASPETIINLLDVLEEDARVSAREAKAQASGEFAPNPDEVQLQFDNVFGGYQLADHEGEALPPQQG